MTLEFEKLTQQPKEFDTDSAFLPSLQEVMVNANIDYRLPSKTIIRSPLIDSSSIRRSSIDITPNTQCKHCRKVFKNVHAKKKHQSSVHGPKLPCEYCGKHLKVFGRQDLMKQHLDRCKRYKSFLEEQSMETNES